MLRQNFTLSFLALASNCTLPPALRSSRWVTYASYSMSREPEEPVRAIVGVVEDGAPQEDRVPEREAA